MNNIISIRKANFSQLITFAILAIISSSCVRNWPCTSAEGSNETESRTGNLITSIDMDIPADLFITQDSLATETTVELYAPKRILEIIETSFRGHRLVMDFDRCVNNSGNIEVYVTVAELTEIKLNGSGNVYSVGDIHTEDVDLNINGSGDMYMDLISKEVYLGIKGSGDAEIESQADKVRIKINGSGDIDLNGVADQLDIDVIGSGDVDAYNMPVNQSDIYINGSGDVYVEVDDVLRVNINGSGNVYYVGNPDITANIDGAGDLIDKN